MFEGNSVLKLKKKKKILTKITRAECLKVMLKSRMKVIHCMLNLPESNKNYWLAHEQCRSILKLKKNSVRNKENTIGNMLYLLE